MSNTAALILTIRRPWYLMERRRSESAPARVFGPILQQGRKFVICGSVSDSGLRSRRAAHASATSPPRAGTAGTDVASPWVRLRGEPPRIDQREATTLEIAHVASGQFVTMAQRDRSDLRIELRDRASGGTPLPDDIDITGDGGSVERPNASCEVFREHRRDRDLQRLPPLSGREQTHAQTHFRLGYGGH